MLIVGNGGEAWESVDEIKTSVEIMPSNQNNQKEEMCITECKRDGSYYPWQA